MEPFTLCCTGLTFKDEKGMKTGQEHFMDQDVERLLAKAEKPLEVSSKLHSLYRGKIETAPRCRVRDLHDFDVWYTPGVAAPCREIQADPALAYEYTSKWNTIAVISDGTRVLGLGDIGPHAALPVMEGKALLFKYLGGVDAIPLCLDTTDPDRLVETVLLLHPALGGVNLEDIAQPKCFDILNRLRERSPVPVWHDDQQGTATVTLAGLINALKIVEKHISDVRIVFFGAGAANVCIADLIFKAGADPGKCVVYDSKGALSRSRRDLENDRAANEKWRLCARTNSSGLTAHVSEALKGADVLIALSKPGPGTIHPEWIEAMAPDSVVFLCANPVPEAWPWEVEKAGARIIATGRSDFPNQVNNSLGFPGIFRGTLDVRARTITDEMCLEAAREIAATAEDRGMHERSIIPTMDEWEVFPRVAAAVGAKAVDQGIARNPLERKEIYRQSRDIISEAREKTRMLMEHGFIKQTDEPV
jgi:malate dehydrogenase (oxaloacetate-decarboxylating)